nr:serine/threonine-protein kinase/endoribonuclease ire-1 [Tanacetum cinerariifolium]
GIEGKRHVGCVSVMGKLFRTDEAQGRRAGDDVQYRSVWDAGLSEVFKVRSFPFPTVFRTADVGGLGISSNGSLMIAYWAGPSSSLRIRSVLNKVVEMIFYTNESKPLALPWRRTPRLDSVMRASLVLGFPSISPTIVVAGVGPLSGKGAAGDRSTFILLRPGHGQYDHGLSSSPLCLLLVQLGQGPNLMARRMPIGMPLHACSPTKIGNSLEHRPDLYEVGQAILVYMSKGKHNPSPDKTLLPKGQFDNWKIPGTHKEVWDLLQKLHAINPEQGYGTI